MIKPVKIFSLFILSFIILIFSACNMNNTLQNRPVSEKKPSDFNFILNYGVNAKNQLDTQSGKYTKDMISAPSVTTDLKLTDTEMNEIYTLMKNINIFGYPDRFIPKGGVSLSPYQTYSIKLTMGGRDKSIYWKDENVSESKDAVALRNLFQRIHVIVSSKEEYKKLPQPQGGYH